jgi:di/tricarboxylate transporter
MRRVPKTADEPLRADDELDVHGPAAAVERLCAEQQLELVRNGRPEEEVLAEVLLTPRSRLIGQTLAGVRFRSRYGVNVLSLRRQGLPVEGNLATKPLRFADTLLVVGSRERIDLLRGEASDFVVIARSQTANTDSGWSRREYLALAIVATMLVLLTFDLTSPVTAVLLAATSMVLSGCLDMPAAYEEISWATVILIGAIRPMATALQKTGAVDLIVAVLVPTGEAGPVPMLTATIVLTGVMGMFISNTATAALVAPVALSASVALAVSPYPLLMTVAIAASTSFATPVATPANLLVLTPGEYRFADYLRVGLPLQVLSGLVTVVTVPILFPF